jgi:2-polyprenyl-3-methyl-5-hydroxy-6-metoxy-1,4-benzoquinol methylase
MILTKILTVLRNEGPKGLVLRLKNRVRAIMPERARVTDFASMGVIPGGRFEKLLKERFGIDDLNEVTDPVVKLWLNFAASTVQRGEAMKDTLLAHTRISGKRCLDVGCAYGGFPLAMEAAGASESVGIDVNAYLLEYSDALKEDYRAAYKTYQKSILEQEDLRDLGTFDIITCNDVIEHVSDAKAALLNMASILNPGGVMYFEVPNRLSASFVKSDGHFGLFGITVLPKPLADEYFEASFPHPGVNDVYYKGLNFYLNTLKELGVGCEVLNPVESLPTARLNAANQIFIECRRIADTFQVEGRTDLSDGITRRVNRIADLFGRQYERYTALRASDPEKAEELGRRMVLSFAEDFWHILVRKPGDGRSGRQGGPRRQGVIKH